MEKLESLYRIMEEEDIYRVEHGEKPYYQTEEDFYAEHPKYLKNVELSGE